MGPVYLPNIWSIGPFLWVNLGKHTIPMDATVVRLWVSNLCIFHASARQLRRRQKSADRNEKSWNLSTYKPRKTNMMTMDC